MHLIKFVGMLLAVSAGIYVAVLLLGGVGPEMRFRYIALGLIVYGVWFLDRKIAELHKRLDQIADRLPAHYPDNY